MAIKFFGHYLIDEQKLTNEQLVEIVELQEKHNLSLGQLAVNAGLITKKESQKINDVQRTKDKRFGEVALELELLNEDQIDILVSKQKGMKLFFGEAVILKGFMTKVQLEENLREFEESQKIELESINNKIMQIDKNDLIKDSMDVLQKIYFRIIHDNIKLVNIHLKEDIKKDGLISLQKLRGDEQMDFALQCADQVTLNIASNYLRMPFDEIDVDAQDALNEFVNVLLGNVAVYLSDKDERVEMFPPETIDKDSFTYNEFYCFDFSTTKGELSLYIKI